MTQCTFQGNEADAQICQYDMQMKIAVIISILYKYKVTFFTVLAKIAHFHRGQKNCLLFLHCLHFFFNSKSLFSLYILSCLTLTSLLQPRYTSVKTYRLPQQHHCKSMLMSQPVLRQQTFFFLFVTLEKHSESSDLCPATSHPFMQGGASVPGPIFF